MATPTLPHGLRDLAVTWRRVEELAPDPRNARRHSAKQIAQIAASIQEFAFTNPVLVDETGRIMAGHGRVAAAKSLGLTQVPTIRLDHMSAAQKRAFVIADNRLAELAGWDRELLALEFAELSALELDFDLEIIGFETAEIDLLIDGAGVAGNADPADDLPASDGPVVSRPGDLWLLGEHRLLCGNALEPASYRRLMGAERARMVFTDAPYNVPIQGHVCGNGRVRHAEFAMASGEMSEAEFTEFLARSLANMAQVCRDGAVIYAFMDHRHAFELLQASRQAGLRYLNLCVWNKENGGLGSFYRSKHELCFVFKTGTAPHVNTIQLGQHGRYRTNVWDYAGVNSFRPGRLEELEMHPTVKPVALVADAIKDASRRGEIVLDAFAGSGTTLIAAEKTGRRARLIELEPRYVDVAIRRYHKLTGRTARHAETGQGFDERQVQATMAAGA
ncbi:MAG: site-specific DNA-methyltransferase [Rhodospirillales bacterium]|nr:site-specific DNA-methyltransferase [Rhodospirillales bacterium]